MLNLVCTSNVQEIDFPCRDIMTFIINIVTCQETYGPICLKLGMLLDTTKLCTLIPVWMTLVFTQGHRVTGNL